MPEQKVTLNNKRGLHARAATRLVQTAQMFQAQSYLRLGDKTANTRNIMQLLMLAAPCGTELSLQTEGEDAIEALDALVQLIENRFDEDE